ncbi:MAG: hypothetical protein R2909_16135 [Gemmatimonadales bacterium]
MDSNRSLAFLILAAGAAGCGSDPLPPVPTATALAIVTAPSPSAQSGQPLPVQPVVELRDFSGNPVSTRGILVTASLASGGGTLAGTVDVRTDGNGRAVYTDLAISGTVGAKALRFSASGLTAALSSSIALSAGPPVQLTASAGANQTAAAGTALAVSPAVLVVDGAGNPVAGATVTFAVEAGGGSITGAMATSNASGVAAVGSWSLGPGLGQNRLRASIGTLDLLFTATAIVGPPAKLVVEAGDNQAAVIGSAVPTAPSVKLTDAFDNPIAGVAITFAVASGGGAVTGQTPNTNASGVAALGSWTLGLTPGVQTITAARSGVPTLTLTATANDFQISSVSAGGFSSCAVATTGEAMCWGDNSVGQLGDGGQISANVPVTVQGGTLFTQVAIGSGHACGITSGGLAFCWGANASGQLGDGTTVTTPVPVAVQGGLTFSAIGVGDLHSCGLASNTGAVWCWGSNTSGRLGDNTAIASAVPVAVVGGHTFSSISVGAAHACGIRNDGVVLCWGSNGSGRLGDGTTINRSLPTPITTPIGAAAFTSIAAGGAHSCAVDIAGQAFCWGAGGSGALGNGSLGGSPNPVLVSGGRVLTSVAAGLNHSCALEAGGAVYCWGANATGQLGDGTTANRSVPTAVANQLSASMVRLGNAHSCARTAAGSAVCWGLGAQGQLGNSANLQKLLPIGVTPR